MAEYRGLPVSSYETEDAGTVGNWEEGEEHPLGIAVAALPAPAVPSGSWSKVTEKGFANNEWTALGDGKKPASASVGWGPATSPPAESKKKGKGKSKSKGSVLFSNTSSRKY